MAKTGKVGNCEMFIDGSRIDSWLKNRIISMEVETTLSDEEGGKDRVTVTFDNEDDRVDEYFLHPVMIRRRYSFRIGWGNDMEAVPGIYGISICDSEGVNIHPDEYESASPESGTPPSLESSGGDRLVIIFVPFFGDVAAAGLGVWPLAPQKDTGFYVQHLLGQLAAESGLGIVFTDDVGVMKLLNQPVPRTFQWNENPIEFIESTMSAFNFNTKIIGDNIVISPRHASTKCDESGLNPSSDLDMTSIARISKKDMISRNFTLNNFSNYRICAAIGMTDDKTPILAFCALNEETGAPEDPGTPPRTFTIQSTGIRDKVVAMALAQSALMQAISGLYTGSFTIEGNPRLWASSYIEIEDYGDRNGLYHMTKVTHSYSSAGYVTHVESKKEYATLDIDKISPDDSRLPKRYQQIRDASADIQKEAQQFVEGHSATVTSERKELDGVNF